MNYKVKRLLILMLLAILLIGSAKTFMHIPRYGLSFLRSYQGKIIHVADGDTLTVRSDGANSWFSKLFLSSAPENVTIRVYGIDCPEKAQAYGAQASVITKGLKGYQVSIRPMDKDRYGRTVAIVKLEDGATLQELLLRSGAAWVYSQFCNIPECYLWKRLESDARQEHRGLWNDDKAMPPWEWRSHHKHE